MQWEKTVQYVPQPLVTEVKKKTLATKHSSIQSTLRSAKKTGARPQELVTQTDASQPV